jgi:hypothetical protein
MVLQEAVSIFSLLLNYCPGKKLLRFAIAGDTQEGCDRKELVDECEEVRGRSFNEQRIELVQTSMGTGSTCFHAMYKDCVKEQKLCMHHQRCFCTSKQSLGGNAPRAL